MYLTLSWLIGINSNDYVESTDTKRSLLLYAEVYVIVHMFGDKMWTTFQRTSRAYIEQHYIMVAAFLEVTEFNKDHEKVWDGGSTPKSWDFFVREI